MALQRHMKARERMLPRLHFLLWWSLSLVVLLLLLAGFLVLVLWSSDNERNESLDVFTLEEGWSCLPSSVAPQSPHSGVCLKLISVKRKWVDTKRHCADSQQQDARLISVDNEWERRLVVDLIEAENSTHSCDYFWVDGTPETEARRFDCWDHGRTTSKSSLASTSIFHQQDGRHLAIGASPPHQWVALNESGEHCSVCFWERSASVIAGDCDDLMRRGKTKSGVYKIDVGRVVGVDVQTDEALIDFSSARVLCEMESNGGGWTVFQQRLNGDTVFWNRSWEEYRDGFGDLSSEGNFWAGNELLHRLTRKDPNVHLRIELWGDRNPNSSGHAGDYLESEYHQFYIESEANDYVLHTHAEWPGLFICARKLGCMADHLGVGNASLGWLDITFSSGRKFSTVDRISDPMPECVLDYHLGGWWLHYCSLSSLNGEYAPPIEWGNGFGMHWITELDIMNPRKSRMMFRKSVE